MLTAVQQRQAENRQSPKLENIRKLVVIGCGGYIGSHLLEAVLPRTQIEVFGADPITSKIEDLLAAPNLRVHRGYLRQHETLDTLEEEISSADAVINLAAICNPAEYNTRPLDVIYSNFLDSYPLVEMCSKHKAWLIHFSTSEVYGRTIASYLGENRYDDPALYELDESTTPLIMGPIQNQRWSYACAKQLLERFIYAHYADHGLPFTIVRPLNFFGPRMDYIPGRDGEGTPRVLACFMAALMDGQPMQLVDGGHARRTIVSIHDAINATLRILENADRAQGVIFNVGNRNNEVTMAELAEHMRRIYAEVAGDDAYRNHPIEVVSADDFYGEGYEDCDRRMPHLERAETLLGWKPVLTLEETLRETVDYYYDHYVKNPAAGQIAAGE
ncbi:MAG: NAD-dependent epimerase/dehydratase family protein [Alphaproteobacteria bacterium]|nr:NAD-dependent epimerase/dehydratase family protein [Alphaproteobacteria bacterium]